MASGRFAEVDKDSCIACGACIRACQNYAIQVRTGCYAVVDLERCIGCGRCAKACPLACIELKDK